jgi:hypothetical protein
MKSLRMFRGYAVAIAAALLLTVSAHAKANKAVVRAVRGGTAEITNDGKNWKPAKVGQQLGEHSAVKTDPNATVDLFLGENGPVVRVTKDTTMGIDRLDVESTGVEKVIETQLDLRNGKILGNVKKMAAASKYEVKTPVGVAGIRGTEYAISADGKVQVYSGTVVLVYIVDSVPQPPITITAGTEVAPPPADGQPARTNPITTPIENIMVGVVPRADGGYDIVDDNGNTIGGITKEGTLVIIVPSDQLPSNVDVTTGQLTTTEPGIGENNGEEPGL